MAKPWEGDRVGLPLAPMASPERRPKRPGDTTGPKGAATRPKGTGAKPWGGSDRIGPTWIGSGQDASRIESERMRVCARERFEPPVPNPERNGCPGHNVVQATILRIVVQATLLPRQHLASNLLFGL
jgi:hypothetical protein